MFILLIPVFAVQSAPLYAQSAKADKQAGQAAVIRNLVDSQNFDFIAQSAMPMRGPVRQLTSDYDLSVTNNRIVSDLPYFGQAYVAPIDPSRGGIQFISKDFEYKATERKKGGWDILIRPKDYSDVQSLTLSIFEDGHASLQVTSTNRQSISFNGYVTAVRPGKKKI